MCKSVCVLVCRTCACIRMHAWLYVTGCVCACENCVCIHTHTQRSLTHTHVHKHTKLFTHIDAKAQGALYFVKHIDSVKHIDAKSQRCSDDLICARANCAANTQRTYWRLSGGIKTAKIDTGLHGKFALSGHHRLSRLCRCWQTGWCPSA